MDNTPYGQLYPLTLPQQALYYDYLLFRNNSKYNMGGVLVLNGDLNIDLFREAYNYVAREFDIFHLRFINHEGELFQTFITDNEANVAYLDFRNQESPLEDAISYIVEENLKPFPFENVCLNHEMILQTAEKQYIWFPRFHHLSNDAYGHSIINNAISDTYNCLLNEGKFPEINSYSYLDFLEDDLQYRQSASFKESAIFWRNKLSPLPEPLDFTVKKQQIKNCSLHTERITLNLHRMCYASMLKIADQAGVSSFQTILGIFFITLYKLYNKNDIIVGMPVLNRNNYRFKNTPGHFMNMIPFRLQIKTDWTLSDILNAIKSSVKESYRHQRFPLNETVKHFRGNPEFKYELFDITIIYRKMDFSQKFGNAKIHSITLDTQVRTESLSLEIDEYDDEDNVNLFFNYNPLIFSEQEAIQIAKCFETILFELIYSPEKNISQVKVLTPFEERRITKTFNQNGTVKQTSQTIISQFSESVKVFPSHTALIHNQVHLSYLELNRKSNELVNQLVEKYAVSKGDIVCLAANRSVDAIIAMLGIMKAGAASLMLDGQLPCERVQYILQNSGARLMITDNYKYSGLPIPVVMMHEPGRSNGNDLPMEIAQNDLAYIIYTSGSTGAPKGVMIEHGSFMNMFVNMIGNFGVKETDRVLQFASLGFDAAIFEIFQALLTGATLVIADQEIVRNPIAFIQYMDEQKVSIATIPPGYLSALDKPELPHLHTLITAGEPAILSDVNHYKIRKKYINAYGPTEASVCASFFIAEKSMEYKESLPIGKTVPGSSIYIVNEKLELLPVGFAGELCISGPNLARGYLNNTELTAAKFVPDPFGKGMKMYRTGDKARFLPDGNIEFLGRIDNQVKIKGNRIELGEIENRLLSHVSVKETVVLDVELNTEKVLAAFIVSGKQPNPAELKKYLQEFLPDYMIPQYFIFPDQIPLTSNGKTDKQKLRKMVTIIPAAVTDEPVVPTELELTLISVFEQVLNYSPIGVNDNFFELGGESLKTARLITRIKKELQLDINFRAVFDHPTVRGVANELMRSENYLVEKIEATAEQEYYPLSHAQKRLWILAQDKANAAVYNMPVSLLLEGELHAEHLKKAINVVVERYEILRTIFIETEGNPYQKVLSSFNKVVTEYDFSREPEAFSKARNLLNKEVMVPFNLELEIPFRAHLVKCEENTHFLLLMIHHIAGDGISVGIIMNELSQLYNLLVSNEPVTPQKPLRIQYKDYCVYEQKLLESARYQKEKGYWLKTLRQPLPVLQLPTDRPRPAIKTYSGKYYFGEIDQKLGILLKKFGKENNVSPFMILLAAVNILLHKYSSDEDIIVGSPVAGRNLSELEDQVGVFLNTVALRNKIDNGASFSQFLQQIKIISSEAFSNSNYPFDDLIQYLDIERDTSRAPLFDVLMQYQTTDVTKLNLKSICSSFFPVDYTANKFDLIVTFTENEDKIDFNIGYNTALFNTGRVERMGSHLINILSSVLHHSDILIKDIGLPDPAELLQLRKMIGGPVTGLQRKTVVDIFEEQVKNTPDQTALVFNDIRLSYCQLDDISNVIANKIMENKEIGSQEIIGLISSPSDVMITGILGILKAGAAYLPLSPDLPLERAKFMLTDSRCKVLLTENNHREKALHWAGSGIETINIESIPDPCFDPPRIKSTGTGLAYVIYTSGSTGTPKGVMIEHHSLVNLVTGLSHVIYQDTKVPLTIALISPFYFDASVKQIFYALLNGHCLDVVPDEIRLDGRKLLDYYKKHHIDVSDGTPVHLEIIIDELHPNVKRYLPKRFVVGGQQLMQQTVSRLFALSGDEKITVTNVYGPTECCDVATCLNVTGDSGFVSDTAFSAIPVGRPLDNVQVFILDDQLLPVPVGVYGELCISGEGLARAYLNNPELSARKFVNVDFAPDKRIYRTGDIGRFLEDGNIQLKGRTDDQIKLRGFRIELNEIENCIRSFSTVNAATVAVTGNGNHQAIAAYYTSSSKTGAEELINHLSSYLPDYMIPSYFVEMESLPLTPNGKVDKKALPTPVMKIPNEHDTAVSGDVLETRLCDIWKELLHVERVTPNDNFFKLGGHSLIAIRLVSRIHKEFNIELNIWEVFRYATVSSLAQLLKEKNPSLFCPIEKAEKRDYYPLSHAQRRLWLLSKLEGQNTLYNLPAAILLKGDLDVGAFEKSFQAIVQRHESLRTCLVEIDGEAFQEIEDHLEFTIELLNDSGAASNQEKINALAVEYAQQEFDLTKLPLMRIRLIRLTGNTHLFLFNMHHIIGDGWSLDIMLKELIMYYNAFLCNSTVDIQPLPIQYKEYAIWQNKLLNEAALESIKQYWHNKLKEPRRLMNLPADHKRSEIYSLDGNLLHFSLGTERTNLLTELGGNHHSSLFMTLLSVVYILLYKYTGEEDILVGSPVAGRPHYDLENQIGFFINTLVLRNRVHPESSFGEVLATVNKTLTEAYDNQIYPFDKLVDELGVERLRNRNPLFDVMVAWMVKNGMEMRLTFNGIEAEGLKFNITKSMFDLTFLFEESGGEVILSIEYNTSLFKRERIERISEHFKQLVDNILANPKEKIRNLSVLPTSEKEKLMYQFNTVSYTHEPVKNVLELFSEQLFTHRQDVAVVHENQKLTYSELNQLSIRIARLLIRKVNPGKDDIIAVIVNDPLLLVASVLGVMRTGAAYLPVLSNTPEDRISYIINDSRAKAVLVDSSLTCAPATCLDVRSAPDDNMVLPLPQINRDDLAYVIYTSGSTGVPKGVMIEHRSLSNLILSLHQSVYARYTSPLNELMISSFAFDVSVKQIFATLCHGNTLHILHPEKRLDPGEIIRYMINRKIHIADITPSVFSVMLELGFCEMGKPDLKELFLGSEALPVKLVKAFYANPANKAVQITNFYGPTECCVESSSFRFNTDGIEDDTDIASIGKPTLNQQIYVLDPYLNLCPVGVPGEICIAGKGLARQYLSDPERTNEKFVQFPLLKGTRIYKTGDSGKIRADGNIDFLGRIDEQVKIRGYRIELQEIEKRLREIDGINECAVILFEKDQTSELVAYFTSEKVIEPGTIRNLLERFLPKYMVPSCFMRLDQMPLSANGKIDKKQLPDPETNRKKEIFRNPEDEIEASVIRICSEILRKEGICLTNNFFEIGGNSLNAVRFISRLQREWNVSLALKDIFYHPVLLDISEQVKKIMQEETSGNTTDEGVEMIAPASDDELRLLSELMIEDDND